MMKSKKKRQKLNLKSQKMILLPDNTKVMKNILKSKHPLLQTTEGKINLLLREADKISLLVQVVSYLLLREAD